VVGYGGKNKIQQSTAKQLGNESWIYSNI
jgi:hypothetical protein